MSEQPRIEDSPAALIEAISLDPKKSVPLAQIRLNQVVYFGNDGRVSLSTLDQLIHALGNDRVGLDRWELATFLQQEYDGLVLGHLPLVKKPVQIIYQSEGRVHYRFNQRLYIASFGYDMNEVNQMHTGYTRNN